MAKRILLALYVFAFVTIANAATPDPGTTGTFAVSTQSYDFGDAAFTASGFSGPIEVKAKVYYPTALASGPFPIVIVLHGRHETCYQTSNGFSTGNWPCISGEAELPNYDGYAFMAQKLASHGYIVVSIGANGISAADGNSSDYGMSARAQLIQYHLNLWTTWNTTGGSPFGTSFVGKVDLTRVGTVGHSRGGEGAVSHALLNRQQGSPFGVKAVLTVGPTDYSRPVLNNITVADIIPYCDGDVVDLQGLHYYDDPRYNSSTDTSAKHTILMMGANHNYFNTYWTPGQFVADAWDDWNDLNSSAPYDPYCGTYAAGNKRLTDAEQRAAFATYACAFFRVYLGDETQFAPILETDDLTPPASSTLSATEVHISYHPSSKKRLDVNRTDSQTAKTTNALSGNASQNGLTNYNICGDALANQFCLGVSQNQEPHNDYVSSQKLGLSQLELRWNSADDYYENTIPAQYKNLSQFKAIQFRASVNFQDSPSNQAVDFVVELKTTLGDTQTVRVSTNTNALFFPPGTLSTYLPRIVHNTVKIPLTNYNNIDLTNIESIRFRFNKTASGAINISDLLLSSASPVVLSPTANFTANVTSTCDGAVSFTDNSTYVPNQWMWYFGDGTTSTSKNPTHTYNANGTFTVKEVVTNSAGKDSLTKTSYVTVNRPAGPVVTGDQRNGAGIVNLSATANSGGTLAWYDASTNGNLLTTGTTYSPNISTTTTYYVEEQLAASLVTGGKPDITTGGGGYLNSENGLYFDVIQNCTLKAFTVYASGAGNRTIELTNSGGTVLQSTTVNMVNGQQKITLNYALTPGTNYLIKMKNTSTINLYRNNDGVGFTYPMNIGGLVSITNSTAAVATPELYYYFFYNWEVQGTVGCTSIRMPVTGTVNGATAISSDPGSVAVPVIYPNPANDLLTVKMNYSTAKQLTLELFNSIGERVVYRVLENNGNAFEQTVHINDLSQGVYVVSVTSNKAQWKYKLIKQ